MIRVHRNEDTAIFNVASKEKYPHGSITPWLIPLDEFAGIVNGARALAENSYLNSSEKGGKQEGNRNTCGRFVLYHCG